MNKKVIIIVISIIIIAVLGAIIYISFKGSQSSRQGKEDRENIEKISREFLTSFGTYSYKETDKYLATVKPYCTEEFYQFFKERYALPSQKNIKPEAENNYSKITINEVSIIDYSKDKAIVESRFTIERLNINIGPEPRIFDDSFKLTLTKQGDEWKIDNMVSIKSK